MKTGDRKDGFLLRDTDSMHLIMPLMYPNRCDNEAFISERIDLSNVESYLERKNQGKPGYEYNVFQVMVAAVLKTICLRPRMNCFIANKNMYQRKELTASFTVKMLFSDRGGEALAKLKCSGSENIDDIHNMIYEQVSFCRSEEKDPSTASMDIVQKLPRPLVKAVGACARFLDRHGRMPEAVIATDPFYSSVVLANLGSIGLHSGYHHLTNWGTTSVFCVIGEIKKRPFYKDDGSFEMRQSVDLGLTIDERLADGYYYSKTIRLLKKLLDEPELLEKPLNEKVDY